MATIYSSASNSVDPNLLKTMFTNEFGMTFNQRGSLKNLITTVVDGALGDSYVFNIMGELVAYERVGGEYIQPIAPQTVRGTAYTVTPEVADSIPKRDLMRANNPNWQTERVKRLQNAIVGKTEQNIIDCMSSLSYIQASTDDVTDATKLTKSLALMGNGKDLAGSSLVESDLTTNGTFNFDCMVRAQSIFAARGIETDSIAMILPSVATNLLLKDDRFIRIEYTDEKVLTKKSWMWKSSLGMTIVQDQLSQYGGLPKLTIGSTQYYIGFAFAQDAIKNHVTSDIPSLEIDYHMQTQSTDIVTNCTQCVYVQAPQRVIQIFIKA